MKKYFKNNKKEVITIGISTLLFMSLSILVLTNTTLYIDTQVHSFILDIRSNSLTNILSLLTNLAGATFLLALSIILLLTMKKKKNAMYIFLNLTCSFFINELAKNIFERSRPIGLNLIEETGLSYPSGHAMIGLSFYGFIAYLLYKNSDNKKHKKIIILSTILLTAIIGFSRVYLGVHYLTDIIGGFLLSIIYLTIFIKITQKEKK